MSRNQQQLDEERLIRQYSSRFEDLLRESINMKDESVIEDVIRDRFTLFWFAFVSTAKHMGKSHRDEYLRKTITEILQVVYKYAKLGKLRRLVQILRYLFPTDQIAQIAIPSLRGKDMWKTVFAMWFAAIVNKFFRKDNKSQEIILQKFYQWEDKYNKEINKNKAPSTRRRSKSFSLRQQNLWQNIWDVDTPVHSSKSQKK